MSRNIGHLWCFSRKIYSKHGKVFSSNSLGTQRKREQERKREREKERENEREKERERER